jgi:cell division septation protein DedD
MAPILASALLALVAPALADVPAGVAAWARGDYAAAIREWEVSAAQGDAAALYNLGQAYRFGNGVPQDLTKAEEFFGKAAAQGHSQAADNYAVLRFQRGDRSGALPFLIDATARGDARAQYLLGIANFEGDIVPQDAIRAYALLTLARQGGLPQADTVIAQMDEQIPLYERQKGEELASQLGAEIELKRARQFAPVDPEADEPAAMTETPPATPLASPAEPATAATPAPEPVQPTPAVADEAAMEVAAPVLAPAAVGAWRVQLGAFSVPANADALWDTVKDRPELAGHERIDAGTGRVKRLLAGGFATEAEAKSACLQLAAAGFGCLFVRN